MYVQSFQGNGIQKFPVEACLTAMPSFLATLVPYKTNSVSLACMHALYLKYKIPYLKIKSTSTAENLQFCQSAHAD